MREIYVLVQQTQPFETVAICILPDHLHAIWRLPPNDNDFSKRWSRFKSAFSRAIPAAPARSANKLERREKGIWQRRYWEHLIRNDSDLRNHIDYIHFNPVKHGLVSCVSDWPHSSFHRYVSRGDLPPDWGGDIRELPGSFGE